MRSAALLDLARELHVVRSLAAAMAAARKAIARNTRYDRVYTTILSADGRTYQVVGYVLPNAEMVEQQVKTVELDKDPFLQRVFSCEEPLVLEDLRLIKDADQAQVEAFGLRTAIAIPMMNGTMRLGPLQIATFADQGVMLPTEDEMEFLVQTASLLAVVVARIRSDEEREKLEQQIRSNQRLESLGRLAGEVAHDFNNLFMAVLANAEIALEELKGHPAHLLVKDMQDATLRAARLSKQLLAFSKGQVLDKRVLDIVELVVDTARVVRALLPPEVELQLDLAEGTGLVEADQSQIEQVLMNLLVNARDAIDGQGRISVETHDIDVREDIIANKEPMSAGRYVLISVSDDGRGIPHERQDKIFEPFFTTKSSDRGTGLGLAVVQGIVAQHSGHIVLYSEPGVGTTFKVYLPRSDESPSPTKQTFQDPVQLEGNETILVVDDQEPVRRSVARALERAGYRVEVAGSPDEAMALLESAPVDLLLTDIVMPGPGGLELAAGVREKYPDLPILLMTGYAPSQLGKISLPHISKPFSSAELLVRLRLIFDAAKIRD